MQKLAAAYGTSVNALLRREAVHVDLAPRFRKLINSNDKAEAEAAELIDNLAKAEVELENLLGVSAVAQLSRRNGRSCRATCGRRPSTTLWNCGKPWASESGLCRTS